MRDNTNEEGNKLLQIVRRGSGSVVRWRRAQIVLWSAQGMDVPAIAKIAFTSEDRVREVIHNFNTDGFDSLAPKYSGGRPPKFTLPQRPRSKRSPSEGQPTTASPSPPGRSRSWPTTWCEKGVVDDISHEGLRALLREEGVSFQAIKTWKQSNDPDFEMKKNRVLELYDIADGKAQPKGGDPDVVICYDEFGPLNLQPHPGTPVGRARHQRCHWLGPGGGCRATFTRPHGVRHLLAAYDLSSDQLYGHVKSKKGRTDSSPSCATSADSTRPMSGSPSSWTTSARISRQRRTQGG